MYRLHFPEPTPSEENRQDEDWGGEHSSPPANLELHSGQLRTKYCQLYINC